MCVMFSTSGVYRTNDKNATASVDEILRGLIQGYNPNQDHYRRIIQRYTGAESSILLSHLSHPYVIDWLLSQARENGKYSCTLDQLALKIASAYIEESKRIGGDNVDKDAFWQKSGDEFLKSFVYCVVNRTVQILNSNKLEEELVSEYMLSNVTLSGRQRANEQEELNRHGAQTILVYRDKKSTSTLKKLMQNEASFRAFDRPQRSTQRPTCPNAGW